MKLTKTSVEKLEAADKRYNQFDDELRGFAVRVGTSGDKAFYYVYRAGKLIHLHFFFGGCDWYAAEFDGEDLFFGFAVLNDDMQNAEWGYFALSELKDISIHGLEIDHDLYWEPTPAKEIERIKDWL